MDPPAYTAPISAPKPVRSILDLRSQILANASLLNPRRNDERSSDDHIEVVVGKAGTFPLRSGSGGIVCEKQAMAQTMTASASSSAADKHYAMLVKRSYDRTSLKILIKGEPRDNVEEALEWLLERTSREIHSMVVRHGRQVKDDECCVM